MRVCELIVQTQRKDSLSLLCDNTISRTFLLLPVCTKSLFVIFFFFFLTSDNKWEGMSLFIEELDSSLSLSLSPVSEYDCACVGVSERVNERLVITRGTVRTVHSNVLSKKTKVHSNVVNHG